MSEQTHKAVAPHKIFNQWQRQKLQQLQQEEALRWGLSLLAVLFASGGAVWCLMHLPTPALTVAEPPPAAIAIDMAPEPVSAPPPTADVPLGPQQTLSIPDPAPIEPPKLTAPPAETTTAPPPSDAPPTPTQAAPASGASSSRVTHDPVTWQGALLAQLEKFKRYPPEAMAEHEEGVPTVTFSMDRSGHVLSVKLAKSSGHPLLDAEAVALPKRAQPLPAPPESVRGNPITLTVPVEFYIHLN